MINRFVITQKSDIDILGELHSWIVETNIRRNIRKHLSYINGEYGLRVYTIYTHSTSELHYSNLHSFDLITLQKIGFM